MLAEEEAGLVKALEKTKCASRDGSGRDYGSSRCSGI